MPAIDIPTLAAIRANRARLGDLVVTTPIRLLVDDALDAAVGVALAWFLVNDRVKLLAYRIFDSTKRESRSDAKAPSTMGTSTGHQVSPT